jgi:serine/threonine-protein kinase
MVQLGENIRISVELVDGENNSTLWGETYTRPRSAVYELEETLSKEIADALGIQLSGEDGERLSRRYTENIEAHEAYLKGKADQAKFTIVGTQKAIQYFQKAIEKDPNYALAYTALAECYYWLGQPLRAMPKGEAMPRAEELAMKALEIDNSLSEAHAGLGLIKLSYDWDWAGAEREFKLAIELDPSSARAHFGYGFFLEAMGRFDEAIEEGRRTQQLDPLNPTVALVEYFHNARRYDEAIEQAQILLEINPNFQATYRVLSWPYETQGMYEEAAAAYQRFLILGGATEEEVAGLSDAAALGAESYWRWKLDYWTERAKQEFVPPTEFIVIHAALGEKDQAFELLEKAYDEHEGTLWLLKVSPKFDTLRDDPRFQDLLRRMNLEP